MKDAFLLCNGRSLTNFALHEVPNIDGRCGVKVYLKLKLSKISKHLPHFHLLLTGLPTMSSSLLLICHMDFSSMQQLLCNTLVHKVDTATSTYQKKIYTLPVSSLQNSPFNFLYNTIMEKAYNVIEAKER
jgi:hypothetical protein